MLFLFYANSIKKCSIVLDGNYNHYDFISDNSNQLENDYYYKTMMFTNRYYEYSLNETTKIIYKTSNYDQKNYSTNCNTVGYYKSNTNNNLDPLSSSHLTISPTYNDISILKYFLVQKGKMNKNFFYRLLNFKLFELNDLIKDIDLKLYELKKFKLNYNNLTIIRKRMMKKFNSTFSESQKRKETNKNLKNVIFYESVYFDVLDKTITKMILSDLSENNQSNDLLNLNIMSNHQHLETKYNRACNFYIDVNYWNNVYFETFNRNIGFKTGLIDTQVTNETHVDRENEKQGKENQSYSDGSADHRIFFNYETEHVLDLNLNLNALFNSILLSYAIIYDKQINDLYLSIQTDTNKNHKFKLSKYKRDYWYKSIESGPFKIKVKSTKYDLIKYGVFANFSLNCENTDKMSYIHEYDCEVKQESMLLQILTKRGNF